MADRREWCGALLACARGNEVECNLPKDHEGKHEHIMTERASCPTCGRYKDEPTEVWAWSGPLPETCRDLFHSGESSRGAEEGATPQTETETPNVPKVMPNLLQVATRIREHFPASDGTDSLDVITIAKMISAAVGRAGVAATVETPPQNIVEIATDVLQNCAGDYVNPELRNPEDPQWRINMAIANAAKIIYMSYKRAGETLQPASEPTVTLEEAKAWRQVNWYDSVPQQLDEGLRAFAQSILRWKK